MSEDRDPTAEEIMRVRRSECRQNGHDYTAVLRRGSSDSTRDPTRFHCDHCGRDWVVTVDGRRKDLGS